MLKVAICIPTFRRPEGLKRLLQSLDDLTFSRVTSPRIDVVIIDNDGANPLEAQGFDPQQCSRHRVIYSVERSQGLVYVRNAALNATPADTDFIAFIDDDEWVEPQWLDALLAMQAQTGAAAIQGPVRPIFEVPPEPWMVKGRYFEVGPLADGARLEHGASGNCLLAKPVIDRLNLRFDQKFNFSGGEDIDFFDRLMAKGEQIVGAAFAIAYEATPKSRMTITWLIRRSFRTGNSLGLMALSRDGWLPSIHRLSKGLLRGAAGSMELLFFGLFDRTRAVNGLSNVVWALGTLSAYTGARVNQYGSGP